MKELLSAGHEVTGTYRNYARSQLVKLDLERFEDLERLMNDCLPEVVVHAAGWTWVDGCENDPERAFKENCEQPARVAELCYKKGIRFLYYSTTYVFDGQDGPYLESDPVSPINVYAKSKVAAEEQVASVTKGEALIPRLICVWGREAQKKNFVYQVIRAIEENKELRVPRDQKGNPTWAGDIAYWSRRLIENREKGIWNLCGSDTSMTRSEWLEEILGGLPREKVKWISDQWTYSTYETVSGEQAALRPLHAGGIQSKIQSRYPREVRLPSQLEVLF